MSRKVASDRLTAQETQTLLSNIRVFYAGNHRRIKCFCGDIVSNSIVPHLRSKHDELWNEWCLEFVKLRNGGSSSKTIMKKFSAKDSDSKNVLLFSWTVVENEIQRMVDSGLANLVVRRKEIVESWSPVPEFKLETTTVWDFKRRGDWAVHSSEYRGNWSPHIPRNLILKFAQKGDVVLDPFAGGGTTLIEGWLLGVRTIGVDISPSAYQIAIQKIDQLEKLDRQSIHRHIDSDMRPIMIKGDSRDLVQILKQKGFGKESVDLVCAHPPYLNTLQYSSSRESDLSHISDVNNFAGEIRKIADQVFELLKPKKICAVLIGDVRRAGELIPLGSRVMEEFEKAGFTLKDTIIKVQNKERVTKQFWTGNENGPDYLIAHEYLYLLRKNA
ncbi:MAG: TRM11 family SAM-dependent methyltransferase [Nitrososphaerales archaeon]